MRAAAMAMAMAMDDGGEVWDCDEWGDWSASRSLGARARDEGQTIRSDQIKSDPDSVTVSSDSPLTSRNRPQRLLFPSIPHVRAAVAELSSPRCCTCDMADSAMTAPRLSLD